jgi:hypothetical protein
MAYKSDVETTLVENSDERLAYAEEAKRTGEPLKSAPARGTEVVPYEVANEIAEEHSQRNTYVTSQGKTYAAQLEPFHEAVREDDSFVERTNEEKAQAHHEYSAEFVRRRMESDAESRKLQAEGYQFDLAVQQANLERAREHEGHSIDYAEFRNDFAENSDSVADVERGVLDVLNSQELADKSIEERAEALRNVTRVPQADEHFAEEALTIKDQIIGAEEPYEAHAASFDVLRPHDAPAKEIVKAAGSPQELREKTAVAQLYADNRTEEAVAAEAKMEKTIAKMPTDKVLAKPGKAIKKAEAKVEGKRSESDELPPNPNSN